MATPVTLVDKFGYPVSFVAAEGFTGRYSIIAASAVAASHTGNTDETTLATVAIPAGAMGLNGSLRVTTLWSYPNSGNSKTMRARLGGIGGAAFMSTGATTTASQHTIKVLSNRGVANSQVGPTAGLTSGVGQSGAAVFTSSVDTAVAQDLVLTAQLASAGETITLESYTVELLVP